MSMLRLLGVLRQQTLLGLLRSRIGKKLPEMTLNVRLYWDQKEKRFQPIGRYPIPYKKDLPFDMVELMEEVEKTIGFLPNTFKVLSYRPVEFRAFFAYYNAIINKETGKLSRADKELIIVVTSLANNCLYSVIVHSAKHRVFSKDPELSDQVCVNWRKSNLPAREKAMLEFALAVSQGDDITDDHFTKLEVHGFNREDAWDIASISAFYAMVNRFVNFVNLIPNKEFYSMGRTSDSNDIMSDLTGP
ncbi:uncharacterized protein LOC125344496 isoform X1 [Perognathus longimembris pacificus]|uniref:uncharacterized protein LOC125344496 isoform X1 n=2 Tax=Perognathus longimembris pacificus TaxID=214514 RepID=UPI002018F26B|nr:uncharacterized protein LOC125344496 isoform X1 [Perognathus longimembris pacificus]